MKKPWVLILMLGFFPQIATEAASSCPRGPQGAAQEVFSAYASRTQQGPIPRKKIDAFDPDPHGMTLTEIKQKWGEGHRSYMTEDDRIRFDSLMDDIERSPELSTYIDEMPLFRKLQEKILQDPMLCTAILNIRRNILWDLLENDPEFAALRKAYAGHLMDGKLNAFLFRGDSKKLVTLQRRFYKKANSIMDSFINGLPAPANDLGHKTLVEFISDSDRSLGKVGKWYLPGTEWDLIEFASYSSRSQRGNVLRPGGADARAARFNERARKILSTITRAASNRANLAKSFANHPRIMSGAPPVLSVKAFGIIRRAASVVSAEKHNRASGLIAYRKFIREMFKGEFGVDLTIEQIDLLKKYVTEVDEMTVGPFRSRPEPPQVEFGEKVFEVDFQELGARNWHAVARALAKHESELPRGLKASEIRDRMRPFILDMRRNFTEVDDWLDARVEDLIQGLPAARKGDEARVSAENFFQIARRLDPATARVTPHPRHYADGSAVAETDRLELVKVAETIEKEVQAELVKAGWSHVAQRMVLGFEYVPESPKGGGTVKLLGYSPVRIHGTFQDAMAKIAERIVQSHRLQFNGTQIETP